MNILICSYNHLYGENIFITRQLKFSVSKILFLHKKEREN